MSDSAKSLSEDEPSLINSENRFWIEKTIVKDRIDRESGEHALGKALWSPQKDKRGADIYRQMREVKAGDVVFHLIDNKKFAGFSIAASGATDFAGLDGTDWDKREAYYRVQLRGYTELTPPIERDELLESSQYRPLLNNIRTKYEGVFYNVLFNLREGAYLTQAPIQLVQILNDIYISRTGHSINESWDIPPLNIGGDIIQNEELRSILERYYKEKIVFRSSVKENRYAVIEFDSDKVIVERLDARSPQAVTFSQAEKLIQRVQTEKTLTFSELNSTSVVRNTVIQAEELALASDGEKIVYLPDYESRLKNFLEVLDSQKKSHPLYKPAMLLCVLEGIESGELAENKIPFEWISPRFIKKLKDLGEGVTEQAAAQPFYHLTSDFMWLHAVNEIHDLMEDGREGATAAREKIKYALLKDTYWKLLQDPPSRLIIRKKLEAIMSIKPNGSSPRNIILFGPPGVGKTFTLRNEWMPRFTDPSTGTDESADNSKTLSRGLRYTFTTFHQAFSYEDFIEGIKPRFDEASQELTYHIRPGIFKEICDVAEQNPSKEYAIFIDEINRGNVASIFGELITLIEEDKRLDASNELRATLPYSKKPFGVPQNLYIIGTMNTADRSVEALDTALRRRFTFIEMRPNADLIKPVIGLGVDLKELFRTINERIEQLIDHDHCIGHAYLMDVKTLEDLRSVFANKIIPLLKEYFYGHTAKIGMVLGEKFVFRKKSNAHLLKGAWDIDELDEKEVYELADPLKLEAADFAAIYA